MVKQVTTFSTTPGVMARLAEICDMRAQAEMHPRSFTPSQTQQENTPRLRG